MFSLRTISAVLLRSVIVAVIALIPLLLMPPAAAWTPQSGQTATTESTAQSSESATDAAVDESSDAAGDASSEQSGAESDTETESDAQAAKPDPRIGRKVIVTVDRAPLRTPKNIVWKAYRGEVFTTSLVNGEWLWISN